MKTQKRGQRFLERVAAIEAAYPDDDMPSVLCSSGPMLGEVGYTGDIPELLEYPCNCYACTKEWRDSQTHPAPAAGERADVPVSKPGDGRTRRPA